MYWWLTVSFVQTGTAKALPANKSATPINVINRFDRRSILALLSGARWPTSITCGPDSNLMLPEELV
jgi:hypothetical protein